MSRPRTMGRGGAGERGQAMLLAVVGLVVLAIGMYTSYSLSRAVYEKIRLQTTADATAYSLATVEARTFNFIALANRAQVASYVQMMEAQAALSQATYLEGVMGWSGDFMLANSQLLRAFSFLPGIDSLVEALRRTGSILEGSYEELRRAIDVMERTQWTTQYVNRQTARTQALFATSTLLALATLGQVMAGGAEYVTANDPEARLSPLQPALSALNTASYLQAFDFAAVNTYGDAPAALRARRLMTEVVHASRYGSGVPDYVVARAPGDALLNVIAQLQEVSEGTQDVAGAQSARARVQKALDMLAAAFYVGTTKLLTDVPGGLPDLQETADDAPERSDLSRGDVLVARDQSGLFIPWGRFASVSSSFTHSQHCRYQKPPLYGSVLRLVVMMLGQDFKCRSHDADDHRWRPLLGRGGIQPYLSFAPPRGGVGPAGAGTFNEPDVLVLVNKQPAHLVLRGQVPDLRLRLALGGEPAALDARLGASDGDQDPDGMFAGMNALARAQVYYHRPGAWQEPPNFFNPFWGARLAPKGDMMQRLSEALGASAGLAQLLADNIWMH